MIQGNLDDAHSAFNDHRGCPSSCECSVQFSSALEGNLQLNGWRAMAGVEGQPQVGDSLTLYHTTGTVLGAGPIHLVKVHLVDNCL